MSPTLCGVFGEGIRGKLYSALGGRSSCRAASDPIVRSAVLPEDRAGKSAQGSASDGDAGHRSGKLREAHISQRGGSPLSPGDLRGHRQQPSRTQRSLWKRPFRPEIPAAPCADPPPPPYAASLAEIDAAPNLAEPEPCAPPCLRGGFQALFAPHAPGRTESAREEAEVAMSRVRGGSAHQPGAAGGNRLPASLWRPLRCETPCDPRCELRIAPGR